MKCRIVVDVRDGRKDYWLTKEQVDKLDLPTITVYSSERTWYDPEKKYFALRCC